MSTYQSLVNGEITPFTVLEAMELLAPSSEQQKLLGLVIRKLRDSHQTKIFQGEEIKEAWDALGGKHRSHLSLSEAITVSLRDQENTDVEQARGMLDDWKTRTVSTDALTWSMSRISGGGIKVDLGVGDTTFTGYDASSFQAAARRAIDEFRRRV